VNAIDLLNPRRRQRSGWARRRESPDAPEGGPRKGRLKHVSTICSAICNRCGGSVKIIVWIEDLLINSRILNQPAGKFNVLPAANRLPKLRAPPQTRLFVTVAGKGL